MAAFDVVVNLARALRDQEQTAAQQDQRPARHLKTGQDEKWLGQPDDPGKREQEQNAHDHREGQPDLPRLLLFRGRELVGQDRDEGDVVDPENDFEEREGKKSDPGPRVREPFHKVKTLA
jgi:hypothetical protein